MKYNAFDPALQLWVAACLYIGVRDMRLAFLGSMTEADEDGLYAYCSRLGTSLQVPADHWPADREAFEKYWAEGLARVRYDEPVRQHLLAIVDLEMIPRWMRWGNRSVNRFATVGFLPPEFREAIGLTWSPRPTPVRAVHPRRPVRLATAATVGADAAGPAAAGRGRLRIRRGWKLT